MPPRRPAPDATEPLFDASVAADAPLAARMRPRTLDEFVGQPHLVGDEGALTRVVQPGHLPSMVLWGPPGSGKTTLAKLLADRAGGSWRQLSAVSSGVADVRALVAEAKALREAGGRTVAFIDELHRFNKSLQDALLPYVEDGTIALIGGGPLPRRMPSCERHRDPSWNGSWPERTSRRMGYPLGGRPVRTTTRLRRARP